MSFTDSLEDYGRFPFPHKSKRGDPADRCATWGHSFAVEARKDVPVRVVCRDCPSTWEVRGD